MPARPDARHLLGEQRRQVPLLPDVDVAVDDHGQASLDALTGFDELWSGTMLLDLIAGGGALRSGQSLSRPPVTLRRAAVM
jgi:hypothetical protein